jgi:hypothetical protein
MWELKIEKIENGFVLSHEEEIDDDKYAKNNLNIKQMRKL